MHKFSFLAPSSATPITFPEGDGWATARTGERFACRGRVIELMQPGRDSSATSAHYSKQWGKDVGFLSFVTANKASARSAMPSYQLPWGEIIAQIRKRASREGVRVCDAACGYGGLLADLYETPAPSRLYYLGADIHDSLSDIVLPRLEAENISLIRWDIGVPMPVVERFDYVLCRNALHHTRDPSATLSSLAMLLKPGGTMAFSVYARKTPMREAVDDALRATIGRMSTDEALALAREFTLLGRDLQESAGTITLKQDLGFLGLRKGSYPIQEFLYYFFIKCWYNRAFGEEYSDIVNFDWYHPTYAYRYTLDEIIAMARANGLRVERTASIPAQHFIEAVKQ
jgi:SAM-dependent methyltransferase